MFFEAKLFASLYGIDSHLPYSNKVCLIGDNTSVLYCLRKNISRNFISNCFLQNLADLWRKYPFYLNLRYMNSSLHKAINFFCFNTIKNRLENDGRMIFNW